MAGLMFRANGPVEYVSVPDNIWGVREWYRQNASTTSEIDITDIHKQIDDDDMVVYTSCIYDCESGLGASTRNRGFNRICLGDVLVIISKSLTSDISSAVVQSDPISIASIESMIETFLHGIDSFLEENCEWITGVVGLFPFIQEIYVEGGDSMLYCNNIELSSGKSLFDLNTGDKPCGGIEIDLLTKKYKTRSLRSRQGWIHGSSEEVSRRLGQIVHAIPNNSDESSEELYTVLGQEVHPNTRFCVIS